MVVVWWLWVDDDGFDNTDGDRPTTMMVSTDDTDGDDGFDDEDEVFQWWVLL